METSFPQRIVTPDTPIQPFPHKSLYTHNYQNTSDTLKHSFTPMQSILKVLTRALFLLTKQDICISFLVFLIKIVFAIQYSESVCLQINIQSGFSADRHDTTQGIKTMTFNQPPHHFVSPAFSIREQQDSLTASKFCLPTILFGAIVEQSLFIRISVKIL